MKRILVIGASGSGKSTLAQHLAKRLALPFFPSDPFYWEDDWKEASAGRVRQQVLDVVCKESWVLDGNFDAERDLVWGQADCIIWLDYPITTIFWRVSARNIRWIITRQVIWSGNQMNMRRAISGIRHAVKSFSIKRKTYPEWLAGRSGVKICRFKNIHETKAWLGSLGKQPISDLSAR